MMSLSIPLHPAVFYELSDAQRRGDAAAATRLAAQLVDLQQQAGQYAVPNDFGAR